jgi:hypothetical protein
MVQDNPVKIRAIGRVLVYGSDTSRRAKDNEEVLNRSLYSHFFLTFFPISLYFYPVILNSFPDKLYYHFHYTLPPPKKECSRIKKLILGWRCSSVIEHLLSMCKALGLIPSSASILFSLKFLFYHLGWNL